MCNQKGIAEVWMNGFVYVPSFNINYTEIMTDEAQVFVTPVVLVVTNTPGFNIDGKVDGRSSTSSNSTTTSTSDVHSTPAVMVGSSWFGGQPVVIQQLDTQASIEASRATVAVSQAGVERERVAAEASKDKSKWVRSFEVLKLKVKFELIISVSKQYSMGED
jgi:hypothetical protein